jgi:transposase
MAELTATATCSVFKGAKRGSKKKLTPKELQKVIVPAMELAHDISTQIVENHWNDNDIALLHSGYDSKDKELACKGYVALRQLGWRDAKTKQYLPDRFWRCAEEVAARTLRLAGHRQSIIEAILKAWPQNPAWRTPEEWNALWSALPLDTTKVEVRNRTRQIQNFITENQRLPLSFIDLEPEVKVAKELILAAADKQLVLLRREGQTVRLDVKLPTVKKPKTQKHWQWFELETKLPVTVPGNAKLHTPTLRVRKNQIRLDLPFTLPVPKPPRTHIKALGLDLGLNTFLSGSISELVKGRVISKNTPLFFDASGVSAKLQRLREKREQIDAKLKHQDKLFLGDPSLDYDPILTKLINTLQSEHDFIREKERNLGHNLAWAAAHWVLEQAKAHSCTAIYIEDLATLETKGYNHTLNGKLSAVVRGQVFDAIRHLAAKEGIAVVSVPARGTSSGCPRCNRELKHVKSPHRLSEHGIKWAYCPHCKFSADRDFAASLRIGARGLLAQASTFTNPKTKKSAIKVIVDGPVAQMKAKKIKKSRSSLKSLLPLRQKTPARFPKRRRQRPVGHKPQVSGFSPGTQVVQTQRLDELSLLTKRHNPRFAILGKGFHYHVHSSRVPRVNYAHAIDNYI